MFLFKKMSWYICLLCCIIFLSPEIVASSSAQPIAAVEICKDQPQCGFVGVSKNWPSKGFESVAVTFSNQIFDVKLPSKFDRVSIGWGVSPPYAVWFGDKRVSFGIEEVPDESTSTDYQAIIEEKSRSQWVPIDIFKIIFGENKSTEKEPVNAYEKYLWRTAFFHKFLAYKSTTSAFIYHHGKWNAYTALMGGESKSRLTVITHADYPSRYLTIRDNGVGLEFIEKVIASIKLNKHSNGVDLYEHDYPREKGSG